MQNGSTSNFVANSGTAAVHETTTIAANMAQAPALEIPSTAFAFFLAALAAAALNESVNLKLSISKLDGG